MKRQLGFAAMCLMAFVLISCRPALMPTVVPTPSTDVGILARTFLQALADGQYAEATLLLDPTMKTVFAQAKQRETWESLLSQSGPFHDLTQTRSTREAGYDVVYVTCAFERASIDAKVVFDAQKRVSGLWFSPHRDPSETPPPYARMESFTERDASVGSGSTALAGTLSVPNGQGPFPAVVLVHGSGPNDRDESVGVNRPFRDIAWGLASDGLAVLRYDKRSFAHPEALAAISSTLTVNEEVLDDVVAAVAMLRQQSFVDGKRVFVLGHSLGGTLIPRIASAEQQAAGFIIMAGATRPLEELVLIQSSYLANLDGSISVYEQLALDDLQRQVQLVQDPALVPGAHPEGILGAPVAYWLDLRDYDPARAAAQVNRPLLILQGDRDYQVGVEDLNGWRQALASRSDVQFKLYAGLNHLFMPGEGPSTPAEFETPNHVAQEVIQDIADWIHQQ